MLNANEALEIILDSVQALETISVPLEMSLHSVLAETIIAEENIPPFDNSSMDGYAIRSEDVREIPIVLTIIGEVSAGTVSEKTLQHNEAMHIMTGGEIPAGSDAVIQQEWTERINETQVKILQSVPVGANIRTAGNDIVNGSVVLEKGKLLRPQEIGILASLGKKNVNVFRSPDVAILTTGNELIGIDETLTEGKIRNSNLYVLKAMLREHHCGEIDMGIAKDNRADLREKINEGLQADMLITSGGVSVGKYDLVIETLKEIGIEIKFWNVNIKPGKPLVFGLFKGKPVFGLPGNPVSTAVTFLEFVLPALKKMKGLSKEQILNDTIKITASLEHEILKNDKKRHFVRGILENKKGSLSVRSTGTQTSNVLSSLSQANCLIILPEETLLFSKGEEVEIQLF